MFVYSSYWRTWSRVLQEKNGEFIELNLTDPNGNWDRISDEVIRIHRTVRGRADSLRDSLPMEVIQQMESALGQAGVARMLTFDYLSRIDRDKYRKYANGGAPFAKIDTLTEEF